jgi:uncharacterized protein (DUF1697 family)
MPAKFPVAYAALLRAVNVGGTGKLAMTDLARLCEKQGFCAVKTYIASGNVVFTCPQPEAAVKAALERVLEKHMGKPVPVMVRTARELQATLDANPFPKVDPKKLLVMFYDEPLATSALDGAVTPDGEELSIRGRELFIHFPIGQGNSKIKLPKMTTAGGTGRNLNTVAKLAAMTRALAG